MAARIFSRYLAAVTITGDRSANLDLCLALTAWFFQKPHLLRNETSDFKVKSERPAILMSKYRALGDGAIATFSNVLGLTWLARAGLALVTSRMLSEIATTRLPVKIRQIVCFFIPAQAIFQLSRLQI
jgi:hypothetical protein